MALTKGVNSYATVAEADAYFGDRLDVAAWTEASETQKAQALVTAASMLDSLDWVGTAVSDTQSLAFPRNGVYFDPRLGVAVQLTSAIPSRILTAQYELAYHLLNNDGLLDDTGETKELKIGNIVLKDIKGANKFPSSIRRIVKPLLANKGSSMWWRAN